MVKSTSLFQQSHTKIILMYFSGNPPAKHNAITTSLQRRCNVTKLQQLCNGVVVTLCVYWAADELGNQCKAIKCM